MILKKTNFVNKSATAKLRKRTATQTKSYKFLLSRIGIGAVWTSRRVFGENQSVVVVVVVGVVDSSIIIHR